MENKPKYHYVYDEELDENGLPEPGSLKEALKNLSPLAPELIEGVLRKGHKMLISGSSKAGKSFLLMQLAIALTKGTEWLGFKCLKSKVLYVNLEIDKASFFNRFETIYEAMGIVPKHRKNIKYWNLRGKAMPMDKLVPKLVRKVKDGGYGAIIIDPIYKVITGDENNASDMGAFSNQFDIICNETGAAAIYSHHHSKGAQGFKRAMDRASGSGVFARDPDAQLDMIELELEEGFKLDHLDNPNATAWRLESSLREFANIKPVNFWFEYPLHKIDSSGILEKKYASGDPRANLEKSGKRKQTAESRKDDFDKAFDLNIEEDGTCKIESLMGYLELSERTVRGRIRDYSDEYKYSKGIVERRKL